MKPSNTIAHASLTGDRRINQDRCGSAVSGDSQMIVIADGMGGHPKGEVAAELLVNTCTDAFNQVKHPITDPGRFLNLALSKAHKNIVAYGQEQDPPIDPRTTAVVVFAQKGHAYWAHAGDSRLYLYRAGKVVTRTTDHSYVERLRQQGVITDSERDTHPQRNYVTRCLGGSSINPEFTLGKYKLEKGDILLLCTDGAWSSIDEELMSDALFSGTPLEEAMTALADEAAQKAFPDSDNVTLIALKINSVPTAEPRNDKPADPADKQQELSQAIADLQSAIDIFESEKEQENK
jgi:serine/threonine protein phosphatase PrpC